ncbi:hypothetical protein N9L48_04825 [Psychrosphaera sp.]|nr:hypothetical protein [Psychrosphaera sp.]
MKRIVIFSTIAISITLLLINAPFENNVAPNAQIEKAQPQVFHPSNLKISATLNNNNTSNTSSLSSQQLLESAKNIRRCKGVPKTRNELTVWIDRATSIGEPYEFIEDVSSRFALCSELKSEEHNFIKILLLAIEKGSDDALNELWAVSDIEYFESTGVDTTSKQAVFEHRVKFMNMKYSLAQKLAINGGEKSQLRLIKGFLYVDPATLQPNIVKAVAFAEYAMQTTNNNEFYLKVSFIKNNLLNKMSALQLEQAEDLTQKLLRVQRK